MLQLLKKYDYAVVALWAAILFLPFLGAVHLFDWDEINFAESAREMMVTGNYQKVQINYQSFWEKPPLFFWLQVMSMKIFGVNEYAARFPNALIGIITLLLVYSFSKKRFGRKIAYLWVFCITGSITPHLYFKSGIIDPLYNLFIFLAVYVLHLFSLEKDEKKKTSYSLLLGAAVGLAILTKGPVALIIVLLTLFVYMAFTSFKFFFSIKHFLLVTITALGISLFWFAFELYSNGFTFINEFVSYQADLFKNPVADHGQPFYYHPLVLLFGAFPVSIFALKGLIKRKLDACNPQDNFYLFMMILFWVVLILFSIVKTKIVHYSSCCYLPLTFMAAYQINAFVFGDKKIAKWQIVLFAFIGVVLAMLIGILPFTDVLKHNIIPLIKDDFAVACLSVDASWNGYEFMLGSMLLSMVFVTCHYLFRNESAKGFMLILFFIATFLPALLRLVAPKIEDYSQRPAIEFFENIAGKDCYVCTPGYRSYATYFYAKVMPQSNAKYYDENWLKTGDIDKPTYFVMHVGGSKDHVNDEMRLLYTKGGFEFYKREIPAKKP